MIKIAITGGIGSGKSTVANFIKKLGFPVFSCDEIYHRLQNTDQYIEKIEKVFPDCVNGGRIDKKKLSALVFSNAKALNTLNAISHPLIMERLETEMQTAQSNLVFAEVPLLYEGNFQNRFDKILVVLRNVEKRIESVAKRSSLSITEIIARIKNQYPHEDNISTDPNVFYIKNEGDFSDLENQVKSVIERLS